jgi:hypothetical protein
VALAPKLVPKQPPLVPLSLTLVIVYVLVLEGATETMAPLDIPFSVNVLVPSV